MLECLLDDETHSLNLGTSLLAEIHHALGSITIGKEVVDEDDMIIRSQITVTYTYCIVTVFGERVNHRGNHTFHRLWLLFLYEDYRKMGQVTHHNGRSNTRSLDCDNLVVLDVLEESDKLLRQVHHQDRIHLMVHKAIHLQDSSRKASAFLHNSFFQ